MKIHISRGGETVGKFDKEEVVAGLGEGRFFESDLAWTEGRAEWQRLGVLMASVGEGGGAGSEGGVEWEKEKTSGALFRTIKSVLFSPSLSFRGLSNEGAYWRSYIFFVLCYGLGGMITLLYGAALGGAVGAAAGVGEGGGGGAILTNIATFPVYLCMGALVPFVGAGINHLCLMLVGGANRPFSATMKAYCYSSGAASAFLLIPVCGGIVGGVWSIVCNVIGLAELHGIGRGKAAVAVFLPLAVCCTLAAGIWVLMAVSLSGAAAGR